jgi:hypothetical protein
VPVDIGIEAAGRATRGGKTAPQQKLVPVDRRTARPGTMLMNAGTLELHIVLHVTDESVTLRTRDGRATFTWEDVEATAWQVVET